MNRSDRRKEQRAKPKYMRYNKEQQIAALYKNGITAKDLQKEYERGRDDGITGTFKTIYAAVCLAVEELHGFKRERCKRLLERIDDIVINSLTSTEAIQEVFERIGLVIDFNESFERVKDKNDA